MATCVKGNPTGFSLLGLREVIPDQTSPEQWKELLLNTGNSSSILQIFLDQNVQVLVNRYRVFVY